MRTAAFIAMLISLGLVFSAMSSGGPHCNPVSNCPGELVLMLGGSWLFGISAVVWVVLTFFGWLIRFTAQNWQQGQDQCFDQHHHGRKL
jgi:hypothetical protein